MRNTLILLALLAVFPLPALAQGLDDFWDARTEKQGRRAVEKVLASGMPVEEILAGLRAGREYSAKVPTGRRVAWWVNRDSQRHPYLLIVPSSYDPAKRYPMRVVLHGSINRPLGPPNGSWGPEPGAPEEAGALRLYPAAWYESLWWQGSQIEAVAGMLGEVKRTYNVDENRVTLSGVSDGGTGTWYFAMKDPTPFAAFIPLIGHPGLLVNAKAGVEGDVHPFNLGLRPVYAVNGGKDPLYPVSSVQPLLELFARNGLDLTFHPLPDAGHNLRWYPSEKGAIEAWVSEHPRDPLPDHLRWETEDPEASGRVSWLVIDRLGPAAGESRIDDGNAWDPRQGVVLGLDADLERSDDGILVKSVQEDSVAALAGIEAGDRIRSIGALPTPDLDGLVAALLALRSGVEVPAIVERGGESRIVTLAFPPAFATNAVYPRTAPSGRVVAERDGNRFALRTEGVRALRLLLSPDEVDLSQPIVVEVNGREVFNARVEPDAETLLRWADRDRDRTMLFVAEVRIELPGV